MDVGSLSISESTTGNFGENITITCSTEFDPYPPPIGDVNFVWFFGPDNSTFPADVIKSRTTKNSSTCSSTLRFSPLQSSHAGIYTCHFYVNGRNIHLTASTLVLSQSPITSFMASSNIATVPSSDIAVIVTASTIIVILTASVVLVSIVVTVIVYR